MRATNSLKEFIVSFAIVFVPVVLFSIFYLGGISFAQDVQIDPSQQQPPLCRWVTFRSDRIQWGGSHYEMCYQYSGRTINSIGSTPIHRYGGVPASGYRPSYCYLNQDMLAPVEPGSRGDSLCPPLNDAVKFSVSADKISEGGKFTLNWSAWTAKECVFSGKAPETGNFSQKISGTSNPIEGSRTYDFVKRGIYPFKFSCFGYLDNSKSTSQGTISRDVLVYVGEIPPAPTLTVSIDPQVIKKGESATLSWKGENVTLLSINQGIGVKPSEGSLKLTPQFTTRYTVTASGEFPELGLARKSVTLRVISPEGAPTEEAPIEVPPDQQIVAPPPVEKPKVDLKVNGQDAPLTLRGPARFTLSWNLNQYCVAYGSWVGIKRTAGQEQRTETRSGTYTYKLYCPGVGTDEVKVTVAGAQAAQSVPFPVAEASISTDGKTFSKSIRVIRGEPVRVWLSAAHDVDGDGKASRDATGGWTGLMSFGGRCEFNSDLNQGAPLFEGVVTDPPSVDECTGSLGEVTFYDQPGVYRYGALQLVQSDGKVSPVSYVNVAVHEPPPPDGPPVVDLRINNLDGPVTLGAPADYLLSWNVKDADTCVASDAWGGDKFPVGTQRFVASEKKEFTYTLTCTGKLGTTAKSIFLKVAELPVCDFSALPTTLDSRSTFDRQSALSWRCQFANSCAITPDVDIQGATFGSTRVSPRTTTTYSLTCTNLDGSSSFDQVVEVK
jgi:hypothetical protein